MDKRSIWFHAGKITAMESIQGKAALRSEIRSARPHSSEGLTQNLVRLTLQLGAKRIASYVSDRTEPETTDFNAWVKSSGYELLLPRINGEDLEFAQGELSLGSFGIFEPAGDSEGLETADLILLPALAVDRSGVRLGKGKGFYDRALQSIAKIPLYAVVFDAEVYQQLPHEPHDRRVNGAITPTAIHHFQAS